VASTGGRGLSGASRERTPPRSVEGSSLPTDRFEPVGQKGADRPPLFGRHDTRLAQEIGVQLERDVGLHIDQVSTITTCSTALRADRRWQTLYRQKMARTDPAR
jgi:hypothetical protein